MTTPIFPKVIGLTGAAGNGKDTVRAMLESNGYMGLAFADALRDMLEVLLVHTGVQPEWMTDRRLKEEPIPWLGLSYRHMAQTLGTEWGRHLHPDFWTRVTAMRMANWPCDTRFVLSDVRFENEAKLVRELGGVLWRIERPGVAAVRPHVSETALDGITVDDQIDNSGTLEQLRVEVDWALRRSQLTPRGAHRQQASAAEAAL
jgi:hypothetical protein